MGAQIGRCGESQKTMGEASIAETMLAIGVAARAASRALSIATDQAKSNALTAAAEALRNQSSVVQQANAMDMENGEKAGLTKAMLDRLLLDDSRIESIANSLESIAKLPDPVGEVIADWDRPNGLNIKRVRTPLGVIGVIYESRPNVTADAGALCLKSGNAVILRGGSDSFHSSNAIHRCLVDGLKQAGLPDHSIQIVPTVDRAAVGEMLAGLGGNLDVLVPRGGKSLVARVHSDSRVPVFAHLDGICHVYIDQSADVEMATDIVLNSKLRRTGICGAAETLLVHRQWATEYLSGLIEKLIDQGCEIRGDKAVCSLVDGCNSATQQDWSTEYLDAILSVKIVGDVGEAIIHVNEFGSHHTESIISSDTAAVERFLNEIDSAILLHNASTQFADGGEFGMGAEIGIATGKMHARGPVGVEQLTSFKYQVRGNGQVRPK